MIGTDIVHIHGRGKPRPYTRKPPSTVITWPVM